MLITLLFYFSDIEWIRMFPLVAASAVTVLPGLQEIF